MEEARAAVEGRSWRGHLGVDAVTKTSL
jgi:hypothetical protein